MLLDLIIAIFFLIHLVMKTALFKLLSQTIISRYATNHNIKFQTRLSLPFLNTNFFIPLI
ncbi:hypothetical protein ECC37_03965 [Helicobacter pylori]|nr:hypothetical protein ECC37_03965 [Helicobacter pylori]